MIWSDKELASLSVMSVNEVVERFMSRLGEAENQEIFEKDNFSYLWGALGVAGIKGIPHGLLDKVWKTLKENNVLEAFDKGVLGDFNLGLIKQYPDNRLRAWQNFDNFTADQKFKKLILMPIVAINRKYAQEVDMQAFNPIRVVKVLERYPMSDAVKMMLKDMRGHGAACGISGTEVVEHYEKEKVLKRLCDIIAFGKRKLHEDEKDFLFRFIHEAVVDGFEAHNIGIRDEVFVGLLADSEDLEGKSEIEISHLKERNAEIVDFAKEFDEELGFFEQSAAKLIRYNVAHIPEMMERCLKLMDGDNPKGVVFALELVNLKQFKSAVKILIELAKKGKVTEAGLYIHRVLKYINGAENMLMSIFKLNLKVLKDNGVNAKDGVFREYVARIYMGIVKEFVGVKCYKEAMVLLNDLVVWGWFVDIEDLKEEVCLIVNSLSDLDKSFERNMDDFAKALNLNVFVKGGKQRIGNLNAVSKRAEERFVFDSGVDKKIFDGNEEVFRGDLQKDAGGTLKSEIVDREVKTEGESDNAPLNTFDKESLENVKTAVMDKQSVQGEGNRAIVNEVEGNKEPGEGNRAIVNNGLGSSEQGKVGPYNNALSAQAVNDNPGEGNRAIVNNGLGSSEQGKVGPYNNALSAQAVNDNPGEEVRVAGNSGLVGNDAVKPLNNEGVSFSEGLNGVPLQAEVSGGFRENMPKSMDESVAQDKANILSGANTSAEQSALRDNLLKSNAPDVMNENVETVKEENIGAVEEDEVLSAINKLQIDEVSQIDEEIRKDEELKGVDAIMVNPLREGGSNGEIASEVKDGALVGGEAKDDLSVDNKADFAQSVNSDAGNGQDLSKDNEAKNEITNIKAGIEEWEQGEDKEISRDKFVKFLKVSTKDMDKHFDRIKSATAQAIKRAEEKSLEIKQKFDDDELEEIEKVASDKFMKIKDKFKRLVKK